MSEHRARSVTLALWCASVGVGGGLVLAQALFPARAPSTLDDIQPPTRFTVEDTAYDDARTVQLELTVSADTPIMMHTAGKLTASACRAGEPIVSGSVAAEITGATLVALHTERPLWRSLAMGDRGPDVDAIRVELRSIGAEIAETGAVDSALMRTVTGLLAPGVDTPTELSEVPLERIIWIPESQVTLKSCDLAVGTVVSADAPFGTVAGSLTAAHISVYPSDLLPGDRQLRVLGVSVPVDTSGIVATAEALHHIESSLGYSSRTNAEPTDSGPITAELALTAPAPVQAVAPAAVFGITGTTGCVTHAGTDFAIHIIGSKLGKTFVRTVHEAVQLPKSVERPEHTTRSCEDA